MLRRKSIITRIVFVKRMDRRSQQPLLEDLAGTLAQRVVAHDQVHPEDPFVCGRRLQHCPAILQPRRERLLRQHVLARIQRGHRQLHVRGRWRGDVNDVHLLPLNQLLRRGHMGNAELLRSGCRRLIHHIRHRHCPDTFQPPVLIQTKSPESSGTYQTQPDQRGRRASCDPGIWNLRVHDTQGV